MTTNKRPPHIIKEYVELDGHSMGMFIESVDEDHPVLLFLHGGPGFPEFPLIQQAGLPWADIFTVCYWEQRGTGMSYHASTQGQLDVETLIEDTVRITKHLKQRFKKQKIYLCGHSWGTLLGSAVVHRFPEHFHAYIGIGQMGRPYESNRETYQFLLDTARKTNDHKAAKDIQSVSFDCHFYRNNDYRRILAKYLDKYGGGMKRTGYSNWQGMKDVLATSSYTWKEKWKILQGAFASYEAFGEMMAAADVLELAPRLDVPMYIIHGAYDYQTTLREATRFFDHVEAPIKTLFTFHDCAHAPFLEDQQRFMTILRREILSQTEDAYSFSG